MSAAGSQIWPLCPIKNRSSADLVQSPKNLRAYKVPKLVVPRCMVWILAVIALCAVSLLASPASAQSCDSLCQVKCNYVSRQDCRNCLINCENAPAQKSNPPASPSPTRQPFSRGESKEWVMQGSYCRAKVAKSKWGYIANAYGAIPCCCFGGVDKPKTEIRGGFTSCVSCPEPPKSAGRPCQGGFESSGACSQCGIGKRANWVSAGAGWAGVHEINVYCCKGCKDAPTLEKIEVIPGFAEPFCSCPAP